MGFHQLNIARGFVGRKVEDQKPIGTGGGGIRMEPVETVNIDGIQIGEEHDGNLGLEAYFSHRVEHAGQGGSGIQRSARGGLNGRAISQGIRKGNAQFDDIHTRLLKGGDKRRCGF